jgi:hypothetical protein
MDWSMPQVIECLLCKHEALSSNPPPTPKKNAQGMGSAQESKASRRKQAQDKGQRCSEEEARGK